MGEGTADEMAPAGGAGGMDVDGAASPAAGAEREPAPEAALGGGDDGDDDDDDEDFDEGAFDGLDGDEEEARFPLHAAVEVRARRRTRAGVWGAGRSLSRPGGRRGRLGFSHLAHVPCSARPRADPRSHPSALR